MTSEQQTRAVAHSNDPFSKYEAGLRELIRRMGENHDSYQDMLVYQNRLHENIEQSRLYDDTPERRSTRAQIIHELNRPALDISGLSFCDFCTSVLSTGTDQVLENNLFAPQNKTILILNLLLLGTLVLVFYLFSLSLIDLPFFKRPFSLSCVTPPASAVSLGIFTYAFIHILWHCLSPAIAPIDETTNPGYITAPIKVLVALFNLLHPSMLSRRAFIALAVGVFLIAGVIGMHQVSPFRIQNETDPIIKNFFVQYLGATPHSTFLKPGDVLEIKPNEQALVETIFLNQADVRCTWSTTNDSSSSEQGCATLYNAPFLAKLDTLTVFVRSRCEMHEIYSGLNVAVIP